MSRMRKGDEIHNPTFALASVSKMADAV
jgi:hypothetical protein